MPRNARIVIPDIAHHITQRGNNKQDVFFVDDDREKFLYLLSEQSSRLDWKEIVRRNLEKLDIDKLRIHCRTGRPLGTDKFISKLETVVGRRLRALPVGRPKKKKIKKRKELNR